ncbi:transcriptional regulator, AraC family [Paraburkholderia xenovorans LB400]|uniref:Transcriptional regulator, AraC family n=2 Tax=Paraburkholderia xenovorans TaxID=36873 RepID=Q13HQ3_PARXL|nr:transcriptional regulator, AraC family [Paraburkholderia xenovorans LB400]
MPRRDAWDPQPKRVPTRKEPVMAHLRLPPPDGIIEWHRHTWGQLACPRVGSIRVSAPGMMWIVPLWRAVWIPPGIDHQVVMLGHVEFHALYIEPGASPLPPDACSVIEVSDLMRVLTESVAGSTPASPRHRSLAMQLLLEEIREAPTLPLGLPLPSERRLRTLCAAMMEEPGSDRTLQEWARVVGASDRTLARLFQSELNTSFAIWRRQLRLSRAIDLIGRGVPLHVVAAELGYANAPAFSTMFRHALGFPPSQLAGTSGARRL